jgi:signal transduction histidine kinase
LRVVRARWFGYLFGLATVGLATLLVVLVLAWARLGNPSTVYAIAVLATAALYGRGPAVLSAVTAFLVFNQYINNVQRPVSLLDPEIWLTLLVFLVAALVAGQLATSLRRRAEEARQREREALALYEVARLVPGSTLELQPLLGLILDQLKTIVEYDAAAVVLLDQRDDPVVFDYRGPVPRVKAVGFRIPKPSRMGQVLQEVSRQREPVFIRKLGGPSPFAQVLTDSGVKIPSDALKDYTGVAVPLIVKGRVIGAQILMREHPGLYSERESGLAMIFAQQAAVAIENARLYGEVRERLNQMVGLQKLGATLLQEHDFDRLLHGISVQLQRLTGAEGVALALLDDDGESFELRTAVGPDAEARTGARVPVDGSLIGEAVRTNRAQRSDDAQNDPRGYKPVLVPSSTRSILTVPMRTRQRIVGAMSIYNKQGLPRFSERDAEIATLFAQQAAVAIENARLYEEVRGKAALEERQRLARELHDSVSQALFGITLNAASADELFEVAPQRSRELVRDVLKLADAGLTELRALIFELRPESLEREGLVGALDRQVAAVRARHGLDVSMKLGDEPDLSQPAKEALYRVAQEALQNAVKHARAQTISLVLESGGSQAVLMVTDDGRGFDPLQDFPGHLGLQSMRERATNVGGSVDIDSAPGEGTRLRARVPLVPTGSEA